MKRASKRESAADRLARLAAEARAAMDHHNAERKKPGARETAAVKARAEKAVGDLFREVFR